MLDILIQFDSPLIFIWNGKIKPPTHWVNVYHVYLECPVVRLQSVPRATSHECVKYKVTINSLTPYSKIVWWKGSTVIDLNDPKYKGSTSDDDNAVLQIDEVTKEDEDIYTVDVYNDFGKWSSSSERLEVAGGTMLMLCCVVLTFFLFKGANHVISQHTLYVYC